MFKQIIFCIVLLLPLSAQADWWQAEWPYRVKLTFDSKELQQLNAQTINDTAVLVRLHTGNFSDFFYLKEDASDLRFIADDGKTALPYQVEKFDLVNQMLYVWVKVPKLAASDVGHYFTMYYGNANASAAIDTSTTWETNRIAALHFNEQNNVVVDSSAYQQKAEIINVEHAASLIGNGLKFSGNGELKITASASLQFMAGKGLAFSAWIKPQGEQKDAWIFHQQSAVGDLLLGLRDNTLYARWKDTEVLANKSLTSDAWQHIALNIDAQRIAIYSNGIEVGSQAIVVPAYSAEQTSIGGSNAGHGFVGELDEVEISTVARSPEWFAMQAGTQGQQANWLALAPSEQLGESAGGDTQYMSVIMKNLTVDGWVVMAILAVMAVISWVVIASKSLLLKKLRRENSAFIADFHQLPVNNPAALDADQEIMDTQSSPFLDSTFTHTEHYSNAPLYRLYHQGIHELNLRVGKSLSASANTCLSPQAVSAIRAALDGALVRETQKINKNMVLLTIAIAGGPYLGLLGTVLGVMITFAAIAASGDVNVNAIAPGISAALMATVAGLVVAIPALFAYNYLTVRIKEMQADMHVFADEFITRIAEYHS